MPGGWCATTLDAMASGGMYDHIGGGFARYSVDREWLVPHFEKMLYDQALLVRVYRQAYNAIGVDHYRQVVEETIGYVLRDLRHPDGGFFSAEDADSPATPGDPHGHEGLFHTWTPAEVRDALQRWDDRRRRPWSSTGTASPMPATSSRATHRTDRSPTASPHRGELQRPALIERARQALFDAREHRPRPGLDDKVLTEWNALFLWALADAAAVFQRDDWTAAAVANGEFLLRELRDDRRSLVPFVAGRRTATAPATPRWRPITPRSCSRSSASASSPARRAGSTAATRHRRHDARLVLGPDAGRLVHDRRGRRRRSSCVRRTCSTTPRPRRTRWPHTA